MTIYASAHALMTTFHSRRPCPYLSLLVVHIVACVDGVFHPLDIATSTRNILQLQYSFDVFFLALSTSVAANAPAKIHTVGKKQNMRSCHQCLLIVCRYSQSEFASVTFAMCMASSPVEGTVHGTKGSIKLHNAMHCPTKISVELSGQQTYCLICCTCLTLCDGK